MTPRVVPVRIVACGAHHANALPSQYWFAMNEADSDRVAEACPGVAVGPRCADKRLPVDGIGKAQGCPSGRTADCAPGTPPSDGAVSRCLDRKPVRRRPVCPSRARPPLPVLRLQRLPTSVELEDSRIGGRPAEDVNVLGFGTTLRTIEVEACVRIARMPAQRRREIGTAPMASQCVDGPPWRPEVSAVTRQELPA